MCDYVIIMKVVSATPVASYQEHLPLQVFRRPWPGIMRSVFQNHELFEKTYFKKFPGFYVTGDGKAETSCGKIHSISWNAVKRIHCNASCENRR